MKRDDRTRLLQQRRSALERYEASMNRASSTWAEEQSSHLEQAKAHMDAAKEAEGAYFRGLPAVTMSCCPFDGRPLLRSFDPFDFDGPWWRPDSTPDEPPPCPHFCCLTGSVSLGGQQPRVTEGSVYIGADVPFLIPRLLEFEGMVAVVGQLDMENGCRAYPVAYFANRRPPPEKLTASWARSNFVYTTQMGVHGWRLAKESLDFDLIAWIQRQRVLWCVPQSGNARLGDAVAQYPFSDPLGLRKPIVLRSQGSDRPALVEFVRVS